MSYPANKPLPPGNYAWSFTLSSPRSGSRPCNGTFQIRPGSTLTAVDVLEMLRVDCARQAGIPIHDATAKNFNIHN